MDGSFLSWQPVFGGLKENPKGKPPLFFCGGSPKKRYAQVKPMFGGVGFGTPDQAWHPEIFGLSHLEGAPKPPWKPKTRPSGRSTGRRSRATLRGPRSRLPRRPLLPEALKELGAEWPDEILAGPCVVASGCLVQVGPSLVGWTYMSGWFIILVKGKKKSQIVEPNVEPKGVSTLTYPGRTYIWVVNIRHHQELDCRMMSMLQLTRACAILGVPLFWTHSPPSFVTLRAKMSQMSKSPEGLSALGFEANQDLGTRLGGPEAMAHLPSTLLLVDKSVYGRVFTACTLRHVLRLL